MSLCASLTDTGVPQPLLLGASTAELRHSTLSEITLPRIKGAELGSPAWPLYLLPHVKKTLGM